LLSFLIFKVNFQLFIGFDNPWDAYPTAQNPFAKSFPDIVKDIFPGEHAGSSWFFQTFIYSASFCVDTFFFLSGFLTALALLRRFQKGKAFNAPGLVLHRYLRLVPSFAFIILIFSQVTPPKALNMFMAL